MSEAYAQCDPFQELTQGGCPDCAVWKHRSTSHAPVTSTGTLIGSTTHDHTSTAMTTRLETTTGALVVSSSVTTTTTRLIPTQRVSTSSTSSVTSAPTTTATVSGTECIDFELPAAWSGGGAHSCFTYQELGFEYCRHNELSYACCFCGGGTPGPTSSSTSQSKSVTTTTSFGSVSMPTPTTGTLTTTASMCSDAKLPSAWSGGGVHTCFTYEQHGGLAYCAHKVLAEACCFCTRHHHQLAHSVPTGDDQSQIFSVRGSSPASPLQISNADHSAHIIHLASVSMFMCLMQWFHL